MHILSSILAAQFNGHKSLSGFELVKKSAQCCFLALSVLCASFVNFYAMRVSRVMLVQKVRMVDGYR